MSDDNDRPENDNPEEDDVDEESPETDGDDDSEDEDDSKDDDKKEKDPELQKAIRRRDRALAEARRLKRELEARDKKDDVDPVAEANQRLVRTAAHGVLRGLGVEDKEDRVEILNMLNLSDIDVDDDGADEDAIEEKVELLRRVFGAKSSSPGRNAPRSVKTKRNEKETTTDPDKARYRRILGR